MASAALDFPMYDASALAKDAESKLDGIIKQVSKATCLIKSNVPR